MERYAYLRGMGGIDYTDFSIDKQNTIGLLNLLKEYLQLIILIPASSNKSAPWGLRIIT
jgi:hypothetical protein